MDASFTCQWLFEDEASPAGDAALDRLGSAGMAIPELWFLEITNILGLAERRGRLSRAGVDDALRFLLTLRLVVDGPVSLARCARILDLMRAHHLTAYDATYLELAERLQLPLATKDRALQAAASLAGVALLQAGAA